MGLKEQSRENAKIKKEREIQRGQERDTEKEEENEIAIKKKSDGEKKFNDICIAPSSLTGIRPNLSEFRGCQCHAPRLPSSCSSQS